MGVDGNQLRTIGGTCMDIGGSVIGVLDPGVTVNLNI